MSVPYVAPVNREVEDQRLYSFLESVGSDACRKDIRSFQERILSAREEVLPLLTFYSLGAKVDYSYHTFEEAFEYTVMEYPFSFWQYCKLSIIMFLYSFRVKTSNHSITAKLTKYTPSGLWNL